MAKSDTSRNEQQDDYRLCNKLLQKSIENKLDWDYELPGQVWAASSGIFFSLYFPTSDIVDSTHWRRFTIEEKKAPEVEGFSLILELSNPNDLAASTMGGRPASFGAIEVLDELLKLLKFRYADNVYGKVDKALDDL